MSYTEEYKHDMAMMLAIHAAIDPLLNAIGATLANPASPPERLGDLTDALACTLHAHLRHEEGEGLPLIEATVDDQLWQDFGQEHAKRFGPQAPRVFPWMLDGLDQDKTDHILRALPEPVQAMYRDHWLGAYRQLDRWEGSSGNPETRGGS